MTRTTSGTYEGALEKIGKVLCTIFGFVGFMSGTVCIVAAGTLWVREGQEKWMAGAIVATIGALNIGGAILALKFRPKLAALAREAINRTTKAP
jgi:hypothetical protein